MRDLISLSAFPKSGVTYLGFLMFHCLFGDAAEIGDLERKYVIDIHAWPALRFAMPEGPRIVKSHFPFGPDRPGVGRTAKADAAVVGCNRTLGARRSRVVRRSSRAG